MGRGGGILETEMKQNSVFTSRLRHGHRLGCVVLVVLGTFSFTVNFLTASKWHGLRQDRIVEEGHLGPVHGKSQNSLRKFFTTFSFD